MVSNVRAKRWSFSTKTMIFRVELEGTLGTINGREYLTLLVWVSEQETPPTITTNTNRVVDNSMEVKLSNSVKAGDTIRARLYITVDPYDPIKMDLLDTMSISVCGAKCPKCGEEFTL